MYVLWSLIALVQVLFLPGFLLVRWLRLDHSLAKTWLLSLAISLAVNHFLVLALGAAGIYQRSTLLLVFGLECVALYAGRRPGAWSERLGADLRSISRFCAPPQSTQEPTDAVPKTPVSKTTAPKNAAPKNAGSVSILRVLLFLGGLACLGYFASFGPVTFGSTFFRGDALYSWNRWAQDWADGHFPPAFLMNYPQLIPTSWSMIYTITDSRIQFPARGMMVLFPVATVLAFLDLGVRRNRPEYLWGALYFTVFAGLGLGYTVGTGLVDLPVACLAWIAVYVVLDASEGSTRGGLTSHLVAAVAATVACALTKQAGLHIAAVLPVLAYLAGREGKRTPSRTPDGNWSPGARAAVVAAVLFVTVVPWYAYVQYGVWTGVEKDITSILVGDIHLGRTIPQRVAAGFGMWRHVLTWPFLLFVGAAVLASCWVVRARPVVWLIALPYTALWATSFSYDRRNLALALPFLAMAAGFGTLALAFRFLGRRRGTGTFGDDWFGANAPAGFAEAEDAGPVEWRETDLAAGGPAGTRKTDNRSFGRFALGGGIVGAAALVAIGVGLDVDQRIEAANRSQLLQRGVPRLNQRLYEFERSDGFSAKILTNYRMLDNLPGLRRYNFVNRGAPADEFWVFRTSAETFAATVADEANEIGYILALGTVKPEIATYIADRIADETYRVLFTLGQGQLLEVNSDR